MSKEITLNMTTDQDQFETHYTSARARLQFELDQMCTPPKLPPDYEIREYFAILHQYAPTIAATPIVAAAWLKNALQTKYVGPNDIGALCRYELDARRVRESERRRILEVWHILMLDPDRPGVEGLRKVDPFEHESRVRARDAVMKWLAYRPELDASPER